MDGLMMDYPLTLLPMLNRAKQLFGRKEIVTRYPWGVHRYTYADMYKRTCQLANALATLGVKPGERVGTFAWNSGRHLELYFGIPCSGSVVHTLNIRLHADQLAYIINHAEDQVIFADASVLDLLEPVYDQLTTVKHIVIMGEPGQPLPESSIPDLMDYETLLDAESTSFDWPELDERSAAAMCYTSGTTGHPKGALYTHRSIYIHSLSAATPVTFGLDETDVVMPLVPMFHVLSWGMPYASTWLGAKQVYTGSFMTPPDLAELIQNEKVTYTAGVPTIWLGLLNFLENNPGDISSLRRIPIGGAAAPRSLIEGYAEKHNIEIVHAWGMTEMTPIGSLSYLKSYMSELSGSEKMDYLAKQGLSSLTVDFRLIDDAGNEVPWDGEQPGELQVRGPHVISEYYHDKRSAESFMDGWFRTGDVATIDPEGYMQIVDRTKDLIKSGGEWISTVDLENSIMAHPDVLEAAVVAVPDPKWTERPIALVVPNPNSESCDPDSIRDLLLNSFERWQCPDEYIMVEAIPKTSVGKFDKKVIREHYRDHVTANN
jgi:fatty-acyl-CoA synthase